MPGTPAVHALCVFVASRLFTSLVLLVVWWVGQAAGWPFASYHGTPGFWQLFGGWDTAFLRRIATQGYPTELPVDGSGNVQPNSWAFLPLFPVLMAGVHAVVPVPLTTIGATLSILAGAGAAVVFRGFVAERVDPTRAIWATALFCFAPVAFVMQFAYAESLMLLLVFAFLWLVARRHYWATLPIGVLASFTRPGGLALSLLLAIELIITWRSTRIGQRVALVVSGVVVASAGLSWTVIAAIATGRWDAYVATEQSWWIGFVGRTPLIPFAPWFEFAGQVSLGRRRRAGHPGGSGVGVLVDPAIGAFPGTRDRRIRGELFALPVRRIPSSAEHLPGRAAVVSIARE